MSKKKNQENGKHDFKKATGANLKDPDKIAHLQPATSPHIGTTHKESDFGRRRASTAPASSTRGIMISALIVSVIGAVLLFFVQPHYIFGAILLLIFVTIIIRFPIAGIYAYLLFGYLRPQDLFGFLVLLRPNIFILSLTVISLIVHRRIEGKASIRFLSTDKLFIAFLLAAVLSNVTSIWLSASVETTIELMKIMIFYFAAIMLLDRPSRIQSYFTLYLGSLGFVSLVQIWTYFTVGLTRATGNGGYGIIIGGSQILGGGGPLNSSMKGVHGVGGYSNYFLANSAEFGLGMCLAAALSFYAFLATSNRLLKTAFISMSGMFLVSIMLCGSRGAFVAVVATVIYMLYRHKKLIVGLAIMLILAGPLLLLVSDQYLNRIESIADYDSDASVGVRFQLWKAAIPMVLDYPVFGVGTGNFKMAYGGTYRAAGSDNLYWSPHNIFIQILTEMGIVGFSVYLAFTFSIFWINRKTFALCANDKELHFITYMTYGVDAALVAFVVGGQFITATYYPHLFQLSIWASSLYFIAFDRKNRQVDIIEKMAVPYNGTKK